MTHYDLVLIDDLRVFLQPAEPFILRTEKAGLEWLESLTVEDSIGQLWLDHDLGEDEHGNATDIMSIVNLLEMRLAFDEAPAIGRVFVHTSNNVGGDQMMAALARRVPTLRVNAKEYLRRGTNRELGIPE